MNIANSVGFDPTNEVCDSTVDFFVGFTISKLSELSSSTEMQLLIIN